MRDKELTWDELPERIQQYLIEKFNLKSPEKLKWAKGGILVIEAFIFKNEKQKYPEVP